MRGVAVMSFEISTAAADGIVSALNVKHAVVLVADGEYCTGLLLSFRLVWRSKGAGTTLVTALIIRDVRLV
jgi:hypothetical protein